MFNLNGRKTKMCESKVSCTVHGLAALRRAILVKQASLLFRINHTCLRRHQQCHVVHPHERVNFNLQQSGAPFGGTCLSLNTVQACAPMTACQSGNQMCCVAKTVGLSRM